MYPSLKTPVIGSELILLNLTALYCPWCDGGKADGVLRTPGSGAQNLERGRLLERREIEESGNSVHVKKVQLLRMSRETDRDDGSVREKRIVLPFLERERREHVVVADHDVGRDLTDYLGGRIEADGIGRLDAQLGEIASDVLAQKAMARNT